MTRRKPQGPLRPSSNKEAVRLLAGLQKEVEQMKRGRQQEGSVTQVRSVTEDIALEDTVEVTVNAIDDPAVTHADVMDADFGVST